MRSPLRSILAATALDSISDAVVSTAAKLAAQTGAQLHLVHSLEAPWFPEGQGERSAFQAQVLEAEQRLQAQAERTVPTGTRPASHRVTPYSADWAILDRAREVLADLVIVGPHRGGAIGAHFLGTTADRVIRSADVPCLVVDQPATLPLRRIGVPLDFSDPSLGALETALTWALQMDEGGDAPEIVVMYVGWPVERADHPGMEEEVIVPALRRQVEQAVARTSGAENLAIRIEVLWATSPTEAALAWIQREEIDMVAMGTHGRGGVKRTLIGSMASSLARQTPRPVLLVPPSLWSGHLHTPALERVVIASDFSDASLAAAEWAVRHFAPAAEHRLVHVLEVPEPPAILAGRFGSRDELLRTAREGAAERLEEVQSTIVSGGAEGASVVRTEVLEGQPARELVRGAEAADANVLVIGEHGRSDLKRGAWTVLGTTAERVLHDSPTPVLVVCGAPTEAPARLLVAADGSDASLRALAWADFLRQHFGASLTAVYVESPPLEYNYLWQSSPGRARGAEVGSRPTHEPTAATNRQAWLREQIRRAGADPEPMELRILSGNPAAEIAAECERSEADLIVMGTYGRGTVGRALLGSVAGAVLRTANCPVLLVGRPQLARG